MRSTLATEAGEGPFQIEENELQRQKKKKREWGRGYLRNGRETIILLPNKYSWVSTVRHTIGMQWWSRGIQDEPTKSEGAQSRPGLGGHIQSFSLRAIGKLPLKFFQAGESNVEICIVPRSPAAEHVFCGLEGNQTPLARASWEGAFVSSLGKRQWQAWTRRVVMEMEK